MISSGQVEIARVLHRGDYFKDQSMAAPARMSESNANRALIAAAPELLAALKLAEKFMTASTKYSEPGGVLIAARAAIAKAEGK